MAFFLNLKGDGSRPDLIRNIAYYHCGILICSSIITLFEPNLFMQDFAKKGEHETQQEREKAVIPRFCTRIIAINLIGRGLFGVFALRSGDKDQLVTYCKANIIADVMAIIAYAFNKRWMKFWAFEQSVLIMSISASVNLYAILKS